GRCHRREVGARQRALEGDRVAGGVGAGDVHVPRADAGQPHQRRLQGGGVQCVEVQVAGRGAGEGHGERTAGDRAAEGDELRLVCVGDLREQLAGAVDGDADAVADLVVAQDEHAVGGGAAGVVEDVVRRNARVDASESVSVNLNVIYSVCHHPLDLKGRPAVDCRVPRGRAQGVFVADVEHALVDRDGAVEATVVAGEHQGASPLLAHQTRAGDRAV